MGGKPVVTFGNKDLDPETSNYLALSASYTTQRFTLTVMGYLNFIKDMIIKENLAIDDAAKVMIMRMHLDMARST